MELTLSEKTLLKMLLNRHYHFLEFEYKDDEIIKKEAIELVFSIKEKLEV